MDTDLEHWAYPGYIPAPQCGHSAGTKTASRSRFTVQWEHGQKMSSLERLMLCEEALLSVHKLPLAEAFRLPEKVHTQAE